MSMADRKYWVFFPLSIDLVNLPTMTVILSSIFLSINIEDVRDGRVIWIVIGYMQLG